MGRKGNSAEDLTGGREESCGDTDADDAFLVDSDGGEDNIPNTQPVDDRVLKDVIAYVEVRTKTENRSKGVSKQLQLLGAKVEKKFTNDVTHVVWKDGKKSTRDRALKKGIRIVSVLWVDSCKQNQEHVAESLFPVSAPDDKDVIQIGKLKRMKSMQPKEVEEDIQRSAGRGTRKRRARVLHASPAPLAILNPSSILVAETQPITPVTGVVPHTPSLIPDTPSNMKPCLDLLDSIKKGQGSAHRRLSITDSPNISPSTPLCQRLFQCFTEEANSCAESPSTSVKLHKSGPVRRPNSRKKLAEEGEEMEIDTPSAKAEMNSKGRRPGSTATPSGIKLAKIEAMEVFSPPAEVGASSRGRRRKSTATPHGTKLAKENEENVSIPPVEVAGSSQGRGRRSGATPRGRKSDVGSESSNVEGAGEVTLAKKNFLSSREDKEQDSKKKGREKRDISLKRKLSLDCESSSSQENTSAELKKDCTSVIDGSVFTKRKRRSSSKTSNKAITAVADRNGMSETSDVIHVVASTSTCDTGSTRSSPQKRKSTKSEEDCKKVTDRSAGSKRKRPKSSKESDECLSNDKSGLAETTDATIASTSICGTRSTRSSEERKSTELKESCESLRDGSTDSKGKSPMRSKEGEESISADRSGVSETSNAAVASSSTFGTGSTRSSTRRRSCLPAYPVKLSPEDGQMDQARRRSNRRKSVTPLVNQPSLADHLRQVGLHCSVSSVPGTTSSASRIKGISRGAAPSNVVLKEEEEDRPPSDQKQRTPSSGGSQKSAFDKVGEEPANSSKFGEKENQRTENDTPKALGKRIGITRDDDGRKRKLLSPLPSDLTCSSILSSIDVQNRPSLEEFKLEGSTRHKGKRSALKKDSLELLCTSSGESSVSSEDLDDTQRKENKGRSAAVKEKKGKKRKKVTLSDSMPLNKKKKSTIVMTSLHRSDQEIVMSVVKDLGRFTVTDTVSDTTTHVVVGENRRTLNVLSGIARGCWIVSMDWVYRSVEAGAWLPEEPYEMNIHFPGAMISRLAHGAKSHTDTSPVDIFSSCDALYVPPESNPPRERLVELIEMCGGNISRKVSDAKLCIGGCGRGKKGSLPVVAERWILDCITRFKLLPWDSYKVDKS